jgi:two-component system response regulator
LKADAEVLLIEDNLADVRLALHVMKEQHAGHQVHVVRDGQEALEFLFDERANGESSRSRLGLVLLDLKLPKVNGFEVLKAIRADARTRTLPVVVLSSSNQERDVVQSYELGASGYVQKPVDFDEFRDVVRRIAAYWLGPNLIPRRESGIVDSATGT